MKLKLRELRRQKRMSQQKLSMKSGVAKGYISQIEKGQYKPTIDIICKLCNALGCTPNDLLDCKGDELNGATKTDSDS